MQLLEVIFNTCIALVEPNERFMYYQHILLITIKLFSVFLCEPTNHYGIYTVGHSWGKQTWSPHVQSLCALTMSFCRKMS